MDDAATTSANRDHWTWVAIVVGALILRAVGIDAPSHHPDEGNIVHWVRDMLSSGSLEPAKMSYGTLTLYLQALLLWIVEHVRGMLIGNEAPVLGRRGLAVMRSVSLAASVATVAVLPLLVRTASNPLKNDSRRTRQTGHLAALFLAVSFLSVQCAHYCTVDTLLTLLTTLTVLFAIRTHRTRRFRDAAICGVCAGLAAATKYTGILAILPLAVGAAVCPTRAMNSEPGGTSPPRTHSAVLATAGALSAVPAFFLAMPYAAIQPERLLEALRYESHHYATGTTTQFAVGPDTFRWNLEFLYYTGLGPGLTLLAAFGLAWTLGEITRPSPSRAWDRCLNLLLVVYPLFLLLFLARYVVRFDRNLLPVVPFAAILAARHAQRAWEAITRIRNRNLARVARWGWIAAISLSVVYPLSRDIVFDWQILLPHTRRELKQWVRQLPEGTRVKQHGFKQRSLSWLQKHHYDYVVMSSHSWEPVAAHPERYPRLARRYQEIFKKCKPVALFRNPWFDSDFFAPHHLLNSATVNIYHGPTLMVLQVPPRKGAEGRQDRSPADGPRSETTPTPTPSREEAGSRSTPEG